MIPMTKGQLIAICLKHHLLTNCSKLLKDHQEDLKNQFSVGLSILSKEIIGEMDLLLRAHYKNKKSFENDLTTKFEEYRKDQLAMLYGKYNDEIKILKENVEQNESKLARNYNRHWILASSVIFLRNLFYYRLPQMAINRFDKKKQFDPRLKKVIILFLAGYLLYKDFSISKWLGFASKPISYSISFLLIPKMTFLLSVTKRLGFSSHNVVNHYLPLYEECVQGFSFIGFSLLQSRLSLFSFVYLLLAYVFARRFQKLLPIKKSENLTRNEQSIGTIISFSLGLFIYSRFVFPNALNLLFYIAPYFNSVSDSVILENLSTCLNNSQRCRELSLNQLGLPKNATYTAAKRKFHELSSRFHPDQCAKSNFLAYCHSQFSFFSNAFKRLECLKRPESAICSVAK